MNLTVISAIAGIMITMQVVSVYAISSEKIPLVQQNEQYPGQKITGFCNVILDDDGNLHWQIKVNGLESETQGQFDLGHWAGDVDVPYTADKDGNADSGNQMISASDLPHSIFTQFAACHVYASGDSHYGFPGIATAEIDVI